MAKGKKTGGRKKGTPNKKTLDIEAILLKEKCDPIKGLARIATGKAFPNGDYPTADHVLTANKELAQYVAPKRKAIEHSGSIGTHEESLEELDQDA